MRFCQAMTSASFGWRQRSFAWRYERTAVWMETAQKSLRPEFG